MPQHVKRIKLDRKALRQPDEFQTLSTRAGVWIREHQPIVLGVVGALVVVAVAATLISRVRSSQSQAAAVEFRTAHATFEAGQYAGAAKAFGEIADTYASTSFGRLAVLYRGHALMRQGDTAGAATAYQTFLAGSVASPDLRQAALLGLANAREKSGDAAGAREAYGQAGELSGPFRTDGLLAAARIDEAQGRGVQAHAIYEQLMGSDPDPELRAILTAKLAASGATPAVAKP